MHLLYILTLINIVSSSTVRYVRVDGCDHDDSLCTSPSTNYTERCITNSDGFGLSPVECSCCDESHSCNDDFDRRRRRMILEDSPSATPLTVDLFGKFGSDEFPIFSDIFCISAHFGCLPGDQTLVFRLNVAGDAVHC